jgi:hypothetical protein
LLDKSPSIRAAAVDGSQVHDYGREARDLLVLMAGQLV